MSQNVSSAAVMIGALRVKRMQAVLSLLSLYFFIGFFDRSLVHNVASTKVYVMAHILNGFVICKS